MHLAPQNNKQLINERPQRRAILEIKCEHPGHENNSARRQGPVSVLRRGKKKYGNDLILDGIP